MRLRTVQRQESAERPLPIQTRIGNHSIEPRGKGRTALELSDVREELKKDLLRDIVSGSFVAIKVVEGDGINAILIDLKEQTKPLRIAALTRFDGPVVNGLIACHCAELHRAHIIKFDT